MLFYDVIVLVTQVFVDPLNAVLPVVVVELRVANEAGHLAVATVDYDTVIKETKVII